MDIFVSEYLCNYPIFYVIVNIHVEIMVDFRVRDQLSPSPVDHEKITVGFNQWIKFI